MGTNSIDYKEEADILRAINESHIKINEMLNRNISFLHSNGYMNNEGRLKKEKPILYVVGSLPARPEISRYVKKELNEFQPRFSNYPALAIPIGALMQANDMQLSRDCLWEVRRNSQSTALPLSLFKQVRPTLGKQVVDDNSPMPLAFKLNPLIVEASGGKFRVYAGKRENTYVKEGSDDVFIDLEKAFFLTAFEWSSPSKRMSVVFHFCINEYGNIMIQESSDNPDTNSRRNYCSIYSRNLRPDGKLCNVMDDEVRQLQEEYNDTLKTCMFYVLDGKVLRCLRGHQIPADNPEYKNARNGGYETLNEYFNRLIEGM